MIHEVFITNTSQKLLYGNHKNFEMTENYPIDDLGSRKLAKLKINDVILIILFSQIDNFTASKFLADLKCYLESKNLILSNESIASNYFLFLNALQDLEMVGLRDISNNSTNVYIDIYYNVHTLIYNGKPIINKIFGEIVSDHTEFTINLDTPFEISDSAKIANYHEINYNEKIKFYEDSFKTVFFNVTREDDLFIFESEFKDVFKEIEISIPIGPQALIYKMELSTGKANFQLKSGIVVWKIKNSKFSRETIKIISDNNIQEEDRRSILVNFKIENSVGLGIKVRSCQNNNGGGNKNFWVKHIVRSGNYEIRQI